MSANIIGQWQQRRLAEPAELVVGPNQLDGCFEPFADVCSAAVYVRLVPEDDLAQVNYMPPIR